MERMPIRSITACLAAFFALAAGAEAADAPDFGPAVQIGGGLEAVDLSRSGKVRGSKRIPRTRPFSKKLDQRTPVTDLELLTTRGRGPTAVRTQSHRGPGRTIAASVAR